MFMPMYTCVQWPVLFEWPIARCPRLQLRYAAARELVAKQGAHRAAASREEGEEGVV
jgi:hypothetical protein